MSKWITEITLNNFRAFGKPETLKIPKGNHLLIYGENGSGKSSIYNALKDFFSSSVAGSTTTYKLNKFLEKDGNTTGDVTISISQIGNDSAPVELKFNAPPTVSTNTQPEIILANKFKGFLDYKRMLKIHSLEVADDNQPELFDLILKELLAEHRIPDPKGGATTVEFLKEYESIVSVLSSTKSPVSTASIEELKAKLFSLEEESEFLSEKIKIETANTAELIERQDKLIEDKKAIDNAILIYDAREQLSKLDESVIVLLRSVLTIANKFLKDHFKNKLVLDVNYKKLEFIEKDGKIKESLSLKIKYAETEIEFYQAFLNEARLSSLAICLYLASIKTFVPESDTLKVLYLDDVFIGLDTTNRFPLLEIIKEEFIADGFQVFVSTYDREWFELSRHWFETKIGKAKIKSLELFIEDDGNPNTPDYPVVKPYVDNIARAEAHFKAKDYPATGNYIRKECEAIIKYLLPETYRIDHSGGIVDDLEGLLNQLDKFYDDCDITKPVELTDSVKIYRRALLNPSSHNDSKSQLFKKEIQDAFEVVNKLKVIPKISRTQVADKGRVFTYENATSNYLVEIELAENIWKIEQSIGNSFSKHKFRIKKWNWNGTNYATDANGTVMEEQVRNEFCEQKRSLEDIFRIINYGTQIPIPANLYTEIRIGITGTLNDLLQ